MRPQNTSTAWRLSQTALLSLAALAIAPAAAHAQHGDILVQQDASGQLVTGIAVVPRDPMVEEIGPRVFEAELDPTGYGAEPGFLSFETDLPPGAFDLPGGELFFDVLSYPLTGGASANLWYWDGTGSVSFGAAPAGHKLDLYLASFVARADGSDTFVPGFKLDDTAGGVHLDLNAQLLDAAHDDPLDFAGLVTNDPLDGVYVLSLQLRQSGLTTSEPFFVVFGLAEDDETMEAWIEAAEEYIEANVIPEPSSLVLAIPILAVGALVARRRASPST